MVPLRCDSALQRHQNEAGTTIRRGVACGAMAIVVEGLVKSYGGFHAVKGIDLEVADGEILAFLGPNGAGKTTTIEVLEGFRSRDAGEVRVLGEDPASPSRSWRDRIGIVLQESEAFSELTSRESVAMHAGYYAAPRSVDAVLDIVGLTDSANQRTGKLSGGQKRRLDLALALIGDPALVFLDEPTTGFDPSARRESWGMIEALRQLGSTVLLTTHYMDEAEYLADRIVVIAAGEIVANGTADELATQVAAPTNITWRPGRDEPAPPGALGVVRDDVGGASIEVSSDRATEIVHALTGWALQVGADLDELSVARPTLEDVYLILTGSATQQKAEV